MGPNDKYERGMSLLREWYYDEIRSLANAAIEACCGRLVTELSKEDLSDIPSGQRASARASFVPYRIARRTVVSRDGMMLECKFQERDPDQDRREFMAEWVMEATNNHEFIIYTGLSHGVVAASRTTDAYEEETGEKAPSIEVEACAIMRADLTAHLEHMEDEWLDSGKDDDDV